MNTLEKNIYDIYEILKAVGDDSDIPEGFLIERFNKYRASLIYQYYLQNTSIPPVFVQDYPLLSFTKTDSADDPSVTLASITVGKASLPNIVTLPDDAGIIRITTGSRQIPLQPTDPNELFLRIELNDNIYNQYGYYYILGNTLYIYPYVMVGKLLAVFENPMDCPVLSSGAFRARTMADDYHTDLMTANACILEILTKDFQISRQQIAEILNNAQSEAKVLQKIQ